MKRSVSAFACVSLTCCSFATFPDQSIDTSFTIVGQVGTTTGMTGSGTIISPNHVLTARHVGGTRLWLRNDGQNVSGFVDAVSRLNHPTADLAILTFAPNTFANYSRPLYGDHLGSTPTIVGFGLTATARANGTGYDHLGGSSGRRRATTNTADVRDEGLFGAGDIALFYDIDGAPGAPGDASSMGGDNPIAGEGGLLPGDSGGGWFLNSGSGWRIIGVNSFIFSTGPADINNPSTFLDWGDGGGAVDLNEYSGWIESNAPVPEPATLAVLGLGLAALARRRRPRH